jgi:3-isopropylmalate/(R)-2-methylmalate dehydratase small subunit
MKNLIQGRIIWKFEEDNFDIDRIIGVQNIRETNMENLAQVCMTEYDKDFIQKVKPGDWIVGGKNFGYGHPHKPPMLILRHLGVVGVIAESFSPGFYRGQIADGVPLLKCEDIVNKVDRFDSILIHWNEFTIYNKNTQKTLHYEPLPVTDRKIIEMGGHVNYLKERAGIMNHQS